MAPPTSPSRRLENLGPLISSIGNIHSTPEDTTNVKIENCVGFTRTPLGLAGPLRIQGSEQTNDEFWAPLATCEPTLVASCSRGCKAFNMSGGVHFEVLGEGMSRAPVFMFRNTEDAINFTLRLPTLENRFARDAESTSRFARLQKVTPHIIGSNVHVHFSYFCGDATGQNMVSIATQQICDSLMQSPLAQELRLQDIIIEGQMASDKKPSWGNVKEPRGVRVLAWGSLSNQVCESILGCTTERLYQVQMMLKEGGIRNGQFGCNINTANVVAAMFISCGQDAASVAEGSWSQLTSEYDWETKILKMTLFFPSLPVGVVGGGTSYETQSDALRLLKCKGLHRKRRLAEIGRAHV